MQRVGRIQRLDTKFEKIYIYNFFPAKAIENEINLQAAAENKISMFINLLGNDSQLLTDEPIESHDLFKVLNSEFNDEEEFFDENLHYLKLMRDLRDNNNEFFNRIANLPKKLVVTRKSCDTSLITLMNDNDSKKIFKSTSNTTEEINFADAIKEFYAEKNEAPISRDENYFEYLHRNLNAFKELNFIPESGTSLTVNESKIIGYIDFCLENLNKTDENRSMLNKVRELVEEGYISKSRVRELRKKLESKNELNEFVEVFLNDIDEEDLKINTGKQRIEKHNTNEILLSEYFLD